mmetsp:Transcript_29729/g.62539  ORF Transcript_29729/g.62539 Transcript_29729/m.62539 type:complete len:216 (-) Transcript_29729:714-1361(-)
MEPRGLAFTVSIRAARGNKHFASCCFVNLPDTVWWLAGRDLYALCIQLCESRGLRNSFFQSGQPPTETVMWSGRWSESDLRARSSASVPPSRQLSTAQSPDVRAMSQAMTRPLCATWLAHASSAALGISRMPPRRSSSDTAGSSWSPFRSPQTMAGVPAALTRRTHSASFRAWWRRIGPSWRLGCGNVRCVCSSVTGAPSTVSPTSCTMRSPQSL